jgi:hypothetical protein
MVVLVVKQAHGLAMFPIRDDRRSAWQFDGIVCVIRHVSRRAMWGGSFHKLALDLRQNFRVGLGRCRNERAAIRLRHQHNQQGEDKNQQQRYEAEPPEGPSSVQAAFVRVPPVSSAVPGRLC